MSTMIPNPEIVITLSNTMSSRKLRKFQTHYMKASIIEDDDHDDQLEEIMTRDSFCIEC